MTAKAKVRIEGEDATAAAWKSALKRGNETAEQMKHAWEAAFAGISAAVLAESFKASAEIGDSLERAGKKAGISGRTMSELAYGAKLADVSVESLSTALKKMQVALSNASSGSKAEVDALGAIGLKFEDLKDLKADQQFELIADGISKLKSGEDKARAATELFGKSGADLLPMFEQGAAGIRKARQEAVALGVALTDTQIKSLAEADTAIKKLDASWEHFKTTTAAAAANNGVTDWLNRMAGIIPLEQQLREAKFNVEHPNFFESDATRAANQATLDRLQASFELSGNLHPELGGRGRGSTTPPGYAAIAAGDAAKKAADAQIKEQQRIDDQMMRMRAEFSQQVDADSKKQLQQDMNDEAKRLDLADEWQERWKQGIRDVAEYEQEQQDKAAAETRAVWDNAFEMWEHNGELTAKKLGKYLLVELGQKFLSSMFDKWFSGAGGSSSGIGGTLLGILGSAFGGSRDSGGRGEPGRAYAIGRGAQPEVFIPDSAGTFVPRAGGGSTHVTLAPTYNIYRSNDDPSTLRRMFAENNRQIFDTLERQGNWKPA